MTNFNLGPGTVFFQDPDPREAQAAERAERIEALAEKLFAEWMGRGGGFEHPLDAGTLGQVKDCAAVARQCAEIFVDGGTT